jgi:hypothetical protein
MFIFDTYNKRRMPMFRVYFTDATVVGVNASSFAVIDDVLYLYNDNKEVVFGVWSCRINYFEKA